MRTWWSTILLGGVAVILAASPFPGCSKDGKNRICDPGIVQECPCLGGTQGVQSCSDDGTRWGECECGIPDTATDPDAVPDVAADTDVDDAGDADVADEAGCDASCGTGGETACSGQDLQRCQAGDDGCLSWVLVQHCPDTGQWCQEEGGTWGCYEPPGFCSMTGAPCAASADCPEATIEGFCIDGVTTYYTCLYDSLAETSETIDCHGHSLHPCLSTSDCPVGPECSFNAEAWCSPATGFLCGLPEDVPVCPGDPACDVTGSQVCVICGNGTVDSTQEECDDGNTADGDGCSSRCRYEWHCWTSMHLETDCGCMTADDCSSCLDCYMSWCDECS
jgi:cysteine-rich repeat protein